MALNRIEILKDGATSLYGSDAVAGVINFQTYQEFDGMRYRLEVKRLVIITKEIIL